MKRQKSNAPERAEELIRAMVEKNLNDELHKQIREWFLDAGEGGAVEEALAQWAAKNIRARVVMPGKAERMSFRRLAARLGFVQPFRMKNVRPLRHVALRAAAVLLPVMLAAGGVFLLYDDFYNDRTPAAVENTVLAVGEQGESQIFTLPDGSTVTVGAGSELVYSADGFAAERDVWLDGEAFFTVAHDAGHPFTVHHDEIKVTVLGTEFGVSAHAGHDTAEVILTRGSVVVRHGENRVEMIPGKKAVIDKANHDIRLSDAGAGEIMRVRHEELVISNMPALEAVRLTADYFGKALVVEQGTPAGDTINVILPERVLLESVLTYINRISESVECRISGDEIIVSGK